MIVDENDVLRDEGEAYARKLTAGRRAHDQRPLQRHHPRLPHAQPPPRDRRDDRRRRAGGPRPPQGPQHRLARSARQALEAGHHRLSLRPHIRDPTESRTPMSNTEAHDRPRPRGVRRVRQLEPGHRAALPPRRRDWSPATTALRRRRCRRQPPAQPVRRRRLRTRRASARSKGRSCSSGTPTAEW